MAFFAEFCRGKFVDHIDFKFDKFRAKNRVILGTLISLIIGGGLIMGGGVLLQEF